MMFSVLAEGRTVVSFGGVIIFGAVAALVILFVTFLYRATVFLGGARKEQMLLRMEMGKLAEEVRRLRERFPEENSPGTDADCAPGSH
jgi:hypothetical protein